MVVSRYTERTGGISSVAKSALRMVEHGHSLDTLEPRCQSVDEYSCVKPL